MIKIKQHRIVSIAISIAVILTLSALVTKLSYSNSRIINHVDGADTVSDPFTYIFRIDSDGGSYRFTADQLKTAINSDPKGIYIWSAATGGRNSRSPAGIFVGYDVKTSELSNLNSFKAVLENQLAQLSEVENLSDEQQKEEIRILKQVSIVNERIDTIINTLENPVSSDENTSSESSDLRATSKATFENRNSDSTGEVTGTGRASAELSTITEQPTTPPFFLQTIKWILYFIATIVGIFFKAMWDSPNLKALLRFSNIKPVLIAPIVFYGVYATVNTLSDNLLAVLIAFQNGFFWQSILKAEQNKREAAVEQARFVSNTAEAVENV